MTIDYPKFSPRRKTAAAIVLSLSVLVSGCGGGDSASSDDVSSGASTATETASFPAADITGQQLCDSIDFDAVVTVAGLDVDSLSSALDTSCHYQTFNQETGEANQMEIAVTAVNAGGQPGFDAEVARWAALSDHDEVKAGIGDAAHYLEGAAGQRLLVLDGSNVIQVSSGPIYSEVFNGETAVALAAPIIDSL